MWFIVESVGAMMNRLRNSARPAMTWFGGMVWRPRALRVRLSTTTMRVKPVSMMMAAGAIARSATART